MMDRREFLASPALMAALYLRAAPRLGKIHLCRVAHEGLLGIVPRGCIAEVDPGTEGAAFLGSDATLVVNRNGWRVFSADGANR